MTGPCVGIVKSFTLLMPRFLQLISRWFSIFDDRTFWPQLGQFVKSDFFTSRTPDTSQLAGRFRQCSACVSRSEMWKFTLQYGHVRRKRLLALIGLNWLSAIQQSNIHASTTFRECLRQAANCTLNACKTRLRHGSKRDCGHCERRMAGRRKSPPKNAASATNFFSFTNWGSNRIPAC